ncbi:MAG: hypothetical protein KGJ78_08475 [Alphaproteobacteria bacterium]|nr:hypothetical protein [Alphaproteobacteria bacterium]
MAPEKTARAPLAEGAERFARIVRSVKESQRARTGAPVLAPGSDTYTLSPEEAWARKYTTHCIGPVCYPPLPQAPFARQGEPPKIRDRAVPVEERPQLQSIGQTIGKPLRRSWLGLFRGR